MLGKGAYGEVFEAVSRDTGKSYAVKCIMKEKLKENDGLVGEMLNTEVKVLYECNNPNVIKLYNRLDSTNQIYLILEYCDGIFID